MIPKRNFLTGQLILLLVVCSRLNGIAACAPPAGLTTAAVTSTSASITWNAITGAGGYKVRYRKTGTSSWTTVSSAVNSTTLTGLLAATTYEWKVMTNCSPGNSSYSTVVIFNTLCSSATGLATSNISSSSAQLNWSTTSCDSFLVRYFVTAAPNTVYYKSVTQGTATSTTISGLQASTNYSWAIRTYCMGGQSGSYSTAITFNTLAGACTAPTGLFSSAVISTGATFNWTAAPGASSYGVQYRIVGTSSWTTTSSTTTTKSVTGLTPGSAYEFQVQTICTAGGNSSWSASSTFNTPLLPCSVPSGLFTNSVTTSGATLNWSAVSGAISYNIQYRATGGSSWTSTTSSVTSKIISGLSAGTAYEFQVQTVCSGNSSTWSASGNFTTLSTCTAPGGLNATSITSSSATLNWSAATGALSYAIQYRRNGTTAWTSTTSTTTSKALTGLTPATVYEFQVQTVCSSGNSSWSSSSTFTTANSSTLPVPDHIVVLIEENHGYSQIIGSSSAPYINALANDPMSTLFTQMYGIEHPSQPNYLDLFSGTNQGITTNNLPAAHFTTANLARELINAGRTFVSYCQTLPSVGYDGASSGKYMRKHNPIANWMGTSTNQVPSTLNQPFTAFPSDYNLLPTVSFVIPDLDYDMHDGTIATGDTWFHNNLDGYVQWAKTHNSLFILIYDEDDGNYNNRIAMIFTGSMVKSGTVSTTYNHYCVLRTIEDMYGTTHAGNAASVSSIHGCWLNGYRQSANSITSTPVMQWEIYPNPTSDVINISYDAHDTPVTLCIYDNFGQKISDQALPNEGKGLHEVTFSTKELGLTRGIYFLEMISDGKKSLKKLAVLEN